MRIILVALLLATTCLSACGLQGPLYLPDKSHTVVITPPSNNATTGKEGASQSTSSSSSSSSAHTVSDHYYE